MTKSKSRKTTNAEGWREHVTPRRIVLACGLLVAAVLLFVFREHLHLDEIRTYLEGLDGPALFAALTLLPLAAFPVTPLHVIAGVRFGWAMGLLLIALSIVLQHILAWAAVRVAPDFFERRLAKIRKRIPESTHVPVTVFTALIPGVPYVATIYVLPLIGVPFPIYMLISAPLHTVRSIVSVLFGDMSENLTPARITYLVIYTIVISGASAWLFRHLRSQFAHEKKSRPKSERTESNEEFRIKNAEW
ncbi:MAG: hypothetical protein ACREIA_01670 [Opitutaceae bacterium]